MKEKRSLLIVIFICLLAFAVFLTNASALTETERVNLGYNWLSSKVSPWPSGDNTALTLMALSYDSSLAATGRAKLFLNSYGNGTCWTGTASKLASSCTVKSTSLAVLALNAIGENTEDAERWLLSRSTPYTVTGANWYLQIDSAEATACTVRYDSSAYTVNLYSNKSLSANAGSCLTRDSYGYSIGSNCLDNTYTVKCDKDFYVSLIYKKDNIIYIPANTKTGSAGNYVSTNIETACLADSSSTSSSSQCNYEGNLWAAYALAVKGRDNSRILPYLIGLSDVNENNIPDAFLYLATSDSTYADRLLKLQDPKGYWIFTDIKYDTAIAILALKDYNADARNKARDYILSAQNSEGSWGSTALEKIKYTSLILHAFWPQPPSEVIPPFIQPEVVNDCERMIMEGTCRDDCFSSEEEKSDYDYACAAGKCCGPISEVVPPVTPAEKTCASEGYQCCDKCAYGHQTNLDSSCSFTEMCCSQCVTERSCDELGGRVCSGAETCSITPQITPDGECCLGECGVPTEATKTCAEINGVLCEKGTCTGTLQYASDGKCCIGGQCKKASYLWLIILISVAILAVIFFYLKKKGVIKFGKGGKKAPPSPPFGMPMPARIPLQRPAPAARPAIKPLQPWQPQPAPFKPVQARPLQPQKTKTEEELSETIKKLKEI
jgi:hypothetical protein